MALLWEDKIPRLMDKEFRSGQRFVLQCLIIVEIQSDRDIIKITLTDERKTSQN